MPGASDIRAGAAYVELYVRDSGLAKGLEAAAQKLRALGSSLQSIGTRLMAGGAALKAPLVASVKLFADFGSELNDLSTRTGISVEALSELSYVAKVSGGSLESLETSIKRMQKAIASGEDELGKPIKAFDTLGVSAQRLAQLNPEEQLAELGGRLAFIKDPALRAATALQLFGKAGTDLLPMFEGGRAGFDALRREARELGLTLSTQEAAAADAFGDKLDTLWLITKRAAFAVGAALVPSLTQLVDRLIFAGSIAIKFIQTHKSWFVLAYQVAGALLVAGAAAYAVGTMFRIMGASFALVRSGLLRLVAFGGQAWGWLVTLGQAVASAGMALIAFATTPVGVVILALGALGAAWLYLSGTAGTVIRWLGERFDQLVQDARTALRGMGDALATGDLELAARILWLTLKMEWQRGVNWVISLWEGLKGSLISIWSKAVYGLASILVNAWAGLQAAWTQVTMELAKPFLTFTSTITSLWVTAQNKIAKGFVRLQGLFDSSLDVKGTLKVLDEDQARDQKAREADYQQNLRDIEKGRKDRLIKIELDRRGTLAQLDHQEKSDASERERNSADRLKELEAELGQTKADWIDAVNKAQLTNRYAAAPAKQRKLLNLEREVAGLGESRARVEVQGTFNAFAVSGLGARSLSERTARATEQIAEHTKKLVAKAQNGLVFGP